MDLIGPFLDWLEAHLFAVVFVASFVEATGLPFPGRIILVVSGVVANTTYEVVRLVATAVVGAMLGDHLLYGVGRHGGKRLLRLYCRLSLGSAQCVETTVRYFQRFGAVAVLLARFSTSVRLFAAILAGTGYFRYRRFVLLDLIGTIGYSALWIVVGYLFGAAVIERVAPYGRLVVLVVPTMLVALLAYRLLRRRRYGAASLGPFPPP